MAWQHNYILNYVEKCRNFRLILQKEFNSILLRLAERSSTQHGARKQRLKLTKTCFCQIVKLIYIIGVFGFNDLWRNISFILQSKVSFTMSFLFLQYKTMIKFDLTITIIYPLTITMSISIG